MNKKYEFIYKSQCYEFDLRSVIPASDYIWENIENILQQKRLGLIENEGSTDFTEDSIKSFISYMQKPNYEIINLQNVLTFKRLNKKYRVQNLEAQIEEFIQSHKNDLIVLIIIDKNNLSDEEIKIISDNLFYYIDIKHLMLLRVDFVDRILQYWRLRHPDEQFSKEIKLMNFFIEYFGRYLKPASILFKHINFQKVGRQCLSHIMGKYSNTFNFECIPIDVIKILCSSYASSSQYECDFDEEVTEFNPSNGQEFNGIMRYLTNQTGGNIHDNGTIEITSNSIYSDQHHPKNLVNYNDENKFYESKNESGSFICFDFKDQPIQLTNYSIKTFNEGSNVGGHMRNWVVEVSNDNSYWTTIDSHSNDSTLNRQSYTTIFQVQQQRPEFYRFIRLRQTGKSWNSNGYNYYVFFPFIEFFGKMKRFTKTDNIQVFKPNNGQEFNGIMRYLTNQTGGNIHDNGTIEITSNSICSDQHHPKNLINYNDESKFYNSKNESGSFICFDFKDQPIQLTNYSIKTFNERSNVGGHMRNWVVEVSNDNSYWTTIDSHSNDSTLNRQSYTAIFQVQQQRPEFYRFIRLRQTGKSWHLSGNNYYIFFPFIEFFGKMKRFTKTDNIQVFYPSNGQEFNGIMRYLTNQTGGNIHDNGTIEITSNSIINDQHHPKNLVNYNDENKFYHSKNESGSFICFDFKDQQIQLTNYSIKTYNQSPNSSGNLRNWVVEVSNDNSYWTTIDSHSNDSTLNRQSYTTIFQVQQQRPEFYRFIRLRQTGQSWYSSGNGYYIFFPFIEFFGKLQQKTQPIQFPTSSKAFSPTSGQEFFGIMRYLTDLTGGNIHDNGTIEITSDSINGGNHPKYLVDYQNESTIYQSNGQSNEIVCFDFKDRSIQLTHYSIKTLDSGSNQCGYLKNWVIEVSNDKNYWTIVDNRSNDSNLNRPKFAAVFQVQQQKNEFYRFIRLRHTGDTWCTCKVIKNPFMEFFGKLKQSSYSENIYEFNIKEEEEEVEMAGGFDDLFG